MNTNNHKLKYISICGNIGSGKSTIIESLAKNYKQGKVITEPIHEMKTLLEKFYQDMKKWSFALQMKVLILYNNIYEKYKNESILITERSANESYNIFAENLYKNECITTNEFDLYCEFYNKLNNEPNYFIYIRTDPVECLKRISERSRDCENEISPYYIEDLHKLYDKTYNKEYAPNIYIVDGMQTKSKVYQDVLEIINKINNSNSNTYYFNWLF